MSENIPDEEREAVERLENWLFSSNGVIPLTVPSDVHTIIAALSARPVSPVTREAVKQMLAENGFTPNGGHPHSWRCEHPDRYPGACRCVDEMTDDILALLSVSPPAEVTEHKITQQVPWPPSPDSEYMLSRFECSCGWAGGTFKDLRSNSVERAAYRGQADTHATPPVPVTREALIEAMKAVDSLTAGNKSCSIDGCNHWAGYQDSGSMDWCACHYGADTSECDGQPEPSLPTVERYADAIMSLFPVSPPAEVEQEKLAKAWDEGAQFAAVECSAIDDERQPWVAPGDNPYRVPVSPESEGKK